MPDEILRPPRGWQLRETISKAGKTVFLGPGTEVALKAAKKILLASALGPGRATLTTPRLTLPQFPTQ